MNKANIRIVEYKSDYDDQLFSLLENEGLEWEDYWKGSGKSKYKKALSSSISYLLYKEDALYGYIRCRNDDGFGVYVYDLLIDREYRGNGYGLMFAVAINPYMYNGLVQSLSPCI